MAMEKEYFILMNHLWRQEQMLHKVVGESIYGE